MTHPEIRTVSASSADNLGARPCRCSTCVAIPTSTKQQQIAASRKRAPLEIANAAIKAKSANADATPKSGSVKKNEVRGQNAGCKRHEREN